MNILNESDYRAVWQSLDAVSPAVGFVVTCIHLGKVLSGFGEKSQFGAFGISADEFEALFIINETGGCRPTDVAHYSVMQPAKITRVIDKLEAKELVERANDPGDRRASNLTLSESGRSLLRAAERAFDENTRPLLNRVGAESISALSAALRGILGALSEEKE